MKMINHLKSKERYEERYDRLTVYLGRQDTETFHKMYDEFFKIMPDEPRNSHRAVLHLNLVYMIFAGNKLIDRYDRREEEIRQMMAEDEAKDQQVANARLMVEPKCQHCGETGLRITSKMLHHRKSFDTPEEVLFMLGCPKCNKNTAVWGDGAYLEHRKTYCPKCQAVMNEKDTRNGKVLTTTYMCSACKHSYKDTLDLGYKKEEDPDPDFETDRVFYCLQDEKVRQELRDAKWRYEEMARLGKEMKEKEENKHIYEAMAEIKKPKIVELSGILMPPLEKAGYIEFSLDKPELNRDVYIGFSCLDNRSERDDYDSRKTLQKAIRKALEDTNWRLMSEGITYRLGYLSGRLRAYEREEDIRNLIIQNRKLKPSSTNNTKDEENIYKIKDSSGRDILL